MASRLAKPVTFPLGRSSRATMPLATGSPTFAKTIGIVPLDGNGPRGRACHDDVGLQAHQLLREPSYPIDVSAVPPKVYSQVAAIGPTQVSERLRECGEARLPPGIVFVAPSYEHADPPHAVALLRMRRKRPSRRRAAEKPDEVAAADV